MFNANVPNGGSLILDRWLGGRFETLSCLGCAGSGWENGAGRV